MPFRHGDRFTALAVFSSIVIMPSLQLHIIRPLTVDINMAFPDFHRLSAKGNQTFDKIPLGFPRINKHNQISPPGFGLFIDLFIRQQSVPDFQRRRH